MTGIKYDKMIHKDEFRLRVLLTNRCNKNCYFCLNDFQNKKSKKHAFVFDVIDCIRAYGQFMKSISEESIITFSGGEPGLYPGLDVVLRYAKHYCNTVKVVTNGLAFHRDYIPYVDKWHIGVTDKNKEVIEFKKLTDNISVQIVVTDKMEIERLLSLVSFYRSHDILVKLFVDFFDPRKRKLENKIQIAKNKFKDGVCTRFTGNQINRGEACLGCKKDCVTLKALWYFPDGTSSTCPQGVVEPYDDDSWDETVEKAHQAHSC